MHFETTKQCHTSYHSYLSHISKIFKWNCDCKKDKSVSTKGYDDNQHPALSSSRLILFSVCFLPKAMAVTEFTPKARFFTFENKELFRLDEVKYQHKRSYMSSKKHSIVIFESQLQEYHSHETSVQKMEFSYHPNSISELIDSEVVMKSRKIPWFEITLLDSRKY